MDVDVDVDVIVDVVENPAPCKKSSIHAEQPLYFGAVEWESWMTLVRLGLCCSHPEGFLNGPVRRSLENAVEFFQVARSPAGDGRPLTLARLDSRSAQVESSLEEAFEYGITHVLFLSPSVILPFYSLQSLIDMRAPAVSGISWSWRPGADGELPDIFPRIGFYDAEGRPYPFFGWCAPDVFAVDWCGLDCLLIRRDALEEIGDPLRLLRGQPPEVRVSTALRSRGIPILIDSSIQCPKVLLNRPASGRPEREMVPGPRAWLEFSRDFRNRKIPTGLYDPAYRGRSWYREWVLRCGSAPCPAGGPPPSSES